MYRRSPISTLTDTLVPYTTLFLSLAAAGKARKERHDRESPPRGASEPGGDAAGGRLPAFGTDRATAVGVGCAHVIPPEAKRRSRDRGLALLVDRKSVV